MGKKSEYKILVADDDRALLDLMIRRFEKMGYEADRAEDGRVAQKLIKHNDYDLIVTDIYMPHVTGLSLLRKAKEKDPHMQVVMITAGATLENAVESLNEGAFAYLVKPFDHVKVFDNVVSRAMEFRRLILDNHRMAEAQRRRGDMLENEVAQRVDQLRQRQLNLLDLLGSLPDGIMVVEESGRLKLTSPVAEKWLARELRSKHQPIQSFVETIYDEWAEDKAEVNVGKHRLGLTAVDLSSTENKKGKVVIIREMGNGTVDPIPQFGDPLNQLKHGLAALYQRQTKDEDLYLLKYIAFQVMELERLSGIAAGSDGQSQPPASDVQEDRQVKEEIEVIGPSQSTPLTNQEVSKSAPDVSPSPESTPTTVKARKQSLPDDLRPPMSTQTHRPAEFIRTASMIGEPPDEQVPKIVEGESKPTDTEEKPKKTTTDRLLDRIRSTKLFGKKTIESDSVRDSEDEIPSDKDDSRRFIEVPPIVDSMDPLPQAPPSNQMDDQPSPDDVSSSTQTPSGGLLNRIRSVEETVEVRSEPAPQVESMDEIQASTQDDEQAPEVIKDTIECETEGVSTMQEQEKKCEEMIIEDIETVDTPQKQAAKMDKLLEGLFEKSYQDVKGGGDDTVEDDSIYEPDIPPVPQKVSQSKKRKWPPTRPSESNDFEEYR